VTARLLNVCAGPVAPIGEGRRTVATAIDKRPFDRPVPVSAAGLPGDEIGDLGDHGGVDQALYAYAAEDAAWWGRELGRPTPAGCFGENLRTAGLDVTGSRIGDRWAIGDDGAEVVVTGPRIPCATFATFWGVDDLVRRFLDAGMPGAYLRVVTPGTIAAGDAIRVTHRAAQAVTVADVSRIKTVDRERASDLLDLPDLAHRIRDWAVERTAPA
jgi:MOSC domain-containing protein YiiM